MHPLNFRCLHKEAGGSFDKLPPTVDAKVLQLEEITQNEKMRCVPRSMRTLLAEDLC